jgi:hypothetical protein
LVREIEGLLREYDPGLLELILRVTEPNDDPQRYVVQLLGKIRRMYSERSSGPYASILDRMNHFIHLEDGSPVRGLSIQLSPGERELYATDELNLAELPDRSEFLAALDRIIAEVIRETEAPDDRQ